MPVSAYAVWRHVYNTLLINVDLDLAEVECSGLPQRFPAPLRAMRLDEFAAAFRARVLPGLELFQSPSLVARELPVSWLSMVTADTIEWALAHNGQDAAALLLRRHWSARRRDSSAGNSGLPASGVAGRSRPAGMVCPVPPGLSTRQSPLAG